MNSTAIARDWRTKLVAALVAVATIFGMLMYAGSGTAEASKRFQEPPAACHWDRAVQYYLQHCSVWSPAMGKHIPVQVQPSARGGNASLTLLDGLRMPTYGSDWAYQGGAAQTFVDSNINVVMPGGAPASFYTNWDRPSRSIQQPEGFNYQYETFLTQELPGFLWDNFGIRYENNSIGGLSMGASAAFALQYKYPRKWNQVLSFSGYLNPSSPAMSTGIQIAMTDAGGYNAVDMWGVPGTGRWVDNDPQVNVGRTANSGADIYIAAATGLPSNLTDPIILQDPVGQLTGVTLEALAMASSRQYEASARAAGANVTTNYTFDGIHAWGTWSRDLWTARDHVLRYQNAF